MVYYWKKIKYYFPYFRGGGGGVSESMEISILFFFFLNPSLSVLNVKALVATFNQEKTLVGTFSVIVKTNYETDGSFYSTRADCCWPESAPAPASCSAQGGHRDCR